MASCASGSGGASHGRANALSRERLPGENGPVVAGEDLETECAGEPDQGLERVLVQSGHMEGEWVDAARRRPPPDRRPTRARGACRAPRAASGAPAA